MTPTILVINAGSSSVKFASFQLHGAELHCLFTGNFERLGSAPHLSVKDGDYSILEERHFPNTELRTQEEAVHSLFTWLKERRPDIDLVAIGHRVVHGGPRYSAPVMVTNDVLTGLHDFESLAPLHQPHNLADLGLDPSTPRAANTTKCGLARDPFFRDTLRGYASVMAIPIAGERLPMTWAIGLKKPPRQFTVSDLEETVERAALIGALLENQILAGELARAHDTIDRDARQVGELQRALLPASLPRIAGLEIAANYEPLGRAGGDLYDFFPIHESLDTQVGPDATPSRWCIFIGDVAGHGLAAAVVMAIVQAVLRHHPAGATGPASLLMHANRQLCSKRIGDFVTAFLGIYEPESTRLTYARAGHPPPLLRRTADGSLCVLDSVGACPLGIDASETYKEAVVQIQRGDALLLYTDGITEAGGAQDLFGGERLARVFREGGDRPAELIDRLREAVRAHMRGEAARDDRTLVAVRIL